MNRRGLKWTAAGIVGLALVVLGAHLAWERHRYRLETTRGVIRVGMTRAEVETVLGESDLQHRKGFGEWDGRSEVGRRARQAVGVLSDSPDTAKEASAEASRVPRPPLAEYVPSWFASKDEE